MSTTGSSTTEQTTDRTLHEQITISNVSAILTGNALEERHLLELPLFLQEHKRILAPLKGIVQASRGSLQSLLSHITEEPRRTNLVVQEARLGEVLRIITEVEKTS